MNNNIGILSTNVLKHKWKIIRLETSFQDKQARNKKTNINVCKYCAKRNKYAILPISIGLGLPHRLTPIY